MTHYLPGAPTGRQTMEVTDVFICNNRIVNLASGVAYVGGWTGEGRAQTADGRRAQTGCGRRVGVRRRRQAKITMSRQQRGLLGWTHGRAGKAIPPHRGVT